MLSSLRWWILQRDELGHALLEQEIGGLNPRVGMETLLHRRSVQDVVEREQAHALMVGHPGAQHDAALEIGRQSLGRVVDGFVEAEPADHPFVAQARQVVEHVPRRNRRGQDRRIGGDDEILAQTTLEAEPGNAERAVLVVPVEVAGEVGGLRDAPGHAALRPVLDLALDHRVVGLVEERPGVGAHDEQRHQVLEHRCAPREERSRAAGRASATGRA